MSRFRVNEILGRRPAPVLWPSSRLVLAIAVKLLPTIEADLTADLVEQLALAIVDREDEMRVVRAVMSEALALSHSQHVEIVRLRKRLVGLLDERRQPGTVAA